MMSAATVLQLLQECGGVVGGLVAVILVVVILIAVIKKGEANMLLFKQQLLLTHFHATTLGGQCHFHTEEEGECCVWTQQATWKHNSDIKW